MRRLFLAAGVASLAIAGVAAAKPGGDHGGGGGNPHGGDGGGNPHGGGGGGAPVFAGGGGNPHGGGGGEAPVFAGGGGHGGGHGGGGGPAAMGGGGGREHGGGFAPMFGRGEGGGRGHGSGFAPPHMREFGGGGHGQGRGGYAARQLRAYAGGYGRGGERQHGRAFADGPGHGRSYHGYARQQSREFASERHGHGQHGIAHQQARAFAGDGHRQQEQGQRLARQQMRGFEQPQARTAQSQQLRANSMQAVEQQSLTNGRFNGQAGRNALRGNAAQFANQPAWNGVSPYQSLAYGNNVQILPVQQVEQFVGVPVANVASFAALAPLPSTIQYLYPDTPDYYYRWGDGYLYQVDRTDNLIAALIPLLAGGYLPGQYLPQPYMASYVPSDYGFNSFYPDYGDVCNRYYDGVIYQVDCSDGYVENVIPMYAGGYGVGQLLPSANAYYNVPVQYRDLYYDTSDNGYWYAPGAIYQYDPRTSVITSVAALMSPGFAVGQPLPVGYDAYNVPYGYRETYYDTPDAWYRYSNGYIYQVDPVTQVVTAIVASLLT